MVLLRLQPDQVSKYWDILRYAIGVSVPPTSRLTDRYYVKCLEMLLAGKMQAWVALDKVMDSKLKAVIVTKLIQDELDEAKTLLVHSGTTFDVDPNLREWKGLMLRLMKFAKANGCSGLASYVSNPRLMELYRKIGVTSEYAYAVVALD